jgi:predicted metal-binding membrane protein
MDTMAMSGGATITMAGMPMCGQSGLGPAASFLGMWAVMMAPMMLPSLAPRLWRYRQAVGGAGRGRSALLTLIVAAGYFLIWTLAGAAVYPAASAIGAVTMRHPALAQGVPIAIGLVVLAGGALQLTRWKARSLARCRDACYLESRGHLGASWANPSGAWRHGLRLGLECVQCCAGLTLALVVTGMMDLPMMLAVTGAITLERLAPAGVRIARVTGALMIAAGCFFVLRAGAAT